MLGQPSRLQPPRVLRSPGTWELRRVHAQRSGECQRGRFPAQRPCAAGLWHPAPVGPGIANPLGVPWLVGAGPVPKPGLEPKQACSGDGLQRIQVNSGAGGA